MKLEEAVKIAKENVDKFFIDYKEKNKDNPEMYPLELPEDNDGLFFEFIIESVIGDENE